MGPARCQRGFVRGAAAPALRPPSAGSRPLWLGQRLLLLVVEPAGGNEPGFIIPMTFRAPNNRQANFKGPGRCGKESGLRGEVMGADIWGGWKFAQLRLQQGRAHRQLLTKKKKKTVLGNAANYIKWFVCKALTPLVAGGSRWCRHRRLYSKKKQKRNHRITQPYKKEVAVLSSSITARQDANCKGITAPNFPESPC